MNTRPRKIWTSAEDAILRTHYETVEPADLQHQFTGRSAQSLRHRAARLGLSRPGAPSPWSEAHRAILHEHYPLRGGTYVANLLRCKGNRVRSYAHTHGIVFVGQRTRSSTPAKPAPLPAPAPVPRPAAQHQPGRKATNTLAPLRVVGAATKTSPSTPNLNTSKAARQRAEKANKGVSITALVRAEPADSPGRQIYLLAGRQGGAAASAAFLAWKAAQS